MFWLENKNNPVVAVSVWMGMGKSRLPTHMAAIQAFLQCLKTSELNRFEKNHRKAWGILKGSLMCHGAYGKQETLFQYI